MQVVLACTFRRYSLTTTEPAEPWSLFPLARPQHGMPVRCAEVARGYMCFVPGRTSVDQSWGLHPCTDSPSLGCTCARVRLAPTPTAAPLLV